MPLVADHPPYALQQAFNCIYKWLTRPGATRCIDDGPVPVCLYRNKDNTNACAIGACVPDSSGISHEEGGIVGGSAAHFCREHFANFHGDLDALTSLQYVHDAKSSWNESGVGLSPLGFMRLGVVAGRYNLDLPE